MLQPYAAVDSQRPRAGAAGIRHEHGIHSETTVVRPLLSVQRCGHYTSKSPTSLRAASSAQLATCHAGLLAGVRLHKVARCVARHHSRTEGNDYAQQRKDEVQCAL